MKTAVKKKYLFFVVFFVVCQAGYCQQAIGIDRMIDDFASQKNVTKIKLNRGVMAFASLFYNTMGVKSAYILSFDNSDEEIKERFSEAARNFKDPEFEPFVSVNKEGENVKIMIRIKDDSIKELIILKSGESCALVRLKGSINSSKIDKLINED